MQKIDLTRSYNALLFRANEDYELYRSFISLRHEIFSEEYKWKNITSPDELPIEKPIGFTRNGVYLIVFDVEEKISAIGRGLHIPEERFSNWGFIKQFPSDQISKYKNSIGTIMDVALPKQKRGTIVRYRDRRMTLGQAVFVCIVEELELNQGVNTLMGYSSINGAQNFVCKLGGYLIGKPTINSRGSAPTICYGMVLNNRKRFEEKKSPMSVLEFKPDSNASGLISAFEKLNKSGMCS